MVFKKKEVPIGENIVSSYCDHLGLGLPSKAWVFPGSEICIDNMRKFVYIPDFEDQILSAKANGVKARCDRFLEVMNECDPKTATVKINVLKAVEEVFFSEISEEIDSQEALHRNMEKQIREQT